MRYNGYNLKQLTDESKDVWDYIRDNSLPIVKNYVEIQPDYMFKVLKKAIDDGIIETNSRRFTDLYAFRNPFPAYLCEPWLVRMLYNMGIPIYYRYKKQRCGRDLYDWYRFYAKIEFIGRWRYKIECLELIGKQIDKYIKGDSTLNKRKWEIGSRKQLTDESKDVWDYIRNNSLPIVKDNVEIPPDYMFKVLKKAIDDGIIKKTSQLYYYLNSFTRDWPINLCGMWLVRMLYNMGIPIYYEHGRIYDDYDNTEYLFYAKIKYRRGWSYTDECDKFIEDEINKYIKTNQGGVK